MRLLELYSPASINESLHHEDIMDEVLSSIPNIAWNNDRTKGSFYVDDLYFKFVFRKQKEDWIFDFYFMKDTGEGKQDLTGLAKNKSFRVYAGIVTAMEEFIKDKEPNKISFTGASKKQIKFYKTLLKYFKIKINDLGYKIIELNEKFISLVKNEVYS